MTNVTMTIELPGSVHLRNVGGVAVALDVGRMSSAMIAKGFEVGVKTVLTNTWNGGGKALSDAERLAALEKKLAAIYAGDWNVVERAGGVYVAMEEQYKDERKAAVGASAKQVDKDMRALVEKVFPKSERFTFGLFLDAVATMKAKADGGDFPKVRAGIEAALVARAEAAAAKRAKLRAGLNVEGIDLGL
jgi:hypothetical protein